MNTDCVNISSHSYAWQEGKVESPAGIIPLVSTILTFKDRIGAIKARWNIGRMDYKIPPGLYGVGNPVPDSPVLVTANYKLTFDRFRKELQGLNVWILVLNTEGINVWCAAGKGSFGTEEIVRRIQMVNLTEVVSHRTIVLPQLGAPGVAAHEVFRESGFRVVYGPVYAHDLPVFLSSGMTASHEMRQVHFNMIERMAVAPVELTIWFKYLAFGTLALCLIAGLREFDLNHFKAIVSLMVAAFLIGGLGVPLLLPWIPGRAFAFKGALLGAVFMATIYFSGILHHCTGNNFEAISWWITLPCISSFLGMQFTGCSTFTSQSGVRRELKVFFPLQIMGLASGFIMNVISQFIER